MSSMDRATGVAFVVAALAVVVTYLWWRTQDRNGGQLAPADNLSLERARLAKFAAPAIKASPGLAPKQAAKAAEAVAAKGSRDPELGV